MMFFGILPTRVQSPVALTEIQDWLAGRYLQIEVGFKRYYYYTEQVTRVSRILSTGCTLGGI